MIIIIEIFQENNKHYIKFTGTKDEYFEYLKKIKLVKNKSWCSDKKAWIVSKDQIAYANLIFGPIGHGLKLQPYPYQKEAIHFCIENLESLLVLPCGSGKTICMIGAYLEATHRKIITGPGLIVVKASLKTQWLKEVSKFSDLKALIVKTLSECKNNKKVFERQFDKNKYDLFILNYETLRNEAVRKELHKLKLDFVASDEIHYVKAKDAARSKSLYEFNYAKIKIGSTATPVGKNPIDLFGIFKFVAPKVFPSWSNFQRLYVNYAGYGRVSGFKNLENLQGKIASHIFYKSDEEVSSQLPSLNIIQRYCDMENSQIKMTEQILAELQDLKDQEFSIRSKLKNEIEAQRNPNLLKIEARILALQTFAQEIADCPRLLLISDSEMAKKYAIDINGAKLSLFRDLAEELLSSNEKFAVFCKFERMQKILTEIIQEIDSSVKIAYVNGKIKDKDRYQEVYGKFKDDPNCKVLLLSEAGAEGLNLSWTRYLVEYDLAESYAIQTQRHGRIKRADSLYSSAFIYQLLCNDSWDMIAQKIIEKKESYDVNLIQTLKGAK